MPKLDSTYLIERLKKRIKQIESGEAIEARDINVLLSSKQKINRLHSSSAGLNNLGFY